MYDDWNLKKLDTRFYDNDDLEILYRKLIEDIETYFGFLSDDFYKVKRIINKRFGVEYEDSD